MLKAGANSGDDLFAGMREGVNYKFYASSKKKEGFFDRFGEGDIFSLSLPLGSATVKLKRENKPIVGEGPKLDSYREKGRLKQWQIQLTIFLTEGGR